MIDQKFLLRCSTVLEKTVQAYKKKISEIFEVKFDHKNSKAEFYFFSCPFIEKEKSEIPNMIFTAKYFNPEATDKMAAHLMFSDICNGIKETIGFVGFIRTDTTSKVDESISKAFEILLKHVENSHKLARVVKGKSDSELIKMMDKMDEPEDSGKRQTLSKETKVDLTAFDDDELKDSVEDVFWFYELTASCINEIIEDDDCFKPGWDAQNVEYLNSTSGIDIDLLANFLSARVKDPIPRLHTWKDLKKPQTKPPATDRSSDFYDGRNIMNSSNSFVSEVKEFDKESVQKENEPKTTSQRVLENWNASLVTSSNPELGRGLKPGEKVVLESKTKPLPTSKLFTQAELSKNLEQPSIKRYTIPKHTSSVKSSQSSPKEDFPEPKRAMKRPPIHSSNRSGLLHQLDMSVKGKPISLSPYGPRSSIDAPTAPIDVIDLIDDDVEMVDVENSDMNNNGTKGKRKLFSLEQQEPKPNKFFKNKPSNPNFNSFDGR